MATFERRLQLRRLLEGSRQEWCLRDLAARFGVSKLTVQRDLDELSTAGVPVESRRAGQTLQWFVRRSSAVVAVADDSMALSAAQDALRPFRGTDLYAELERRRSPARSAPVLATRFPQPAQRLRPAVVRVLMAAIGSSRQVLVSYVPRNQNVAVKLMLQPSGFEEVNGIIYLQAAVVRGARCLRRTLVASRVRHAQLLEGKFTPKRRRSRRAFGAVDGAAEEVIVKFDPLIAPFIEERVWHPSQNLTRWPDGSLVWRAKVAGMHEVVGWVMSWGHRAELVAPDCWRDELRQRLDGMVSRYRSAS